MDLEIWSSGALEICSSGVLKIGSLAVLKVWSSVAAVCRFQNIQKHSGSNNTKLRIVRNNYNTEIESRGTCKGNSRTDELTVGLSCLLLDHSSTVFYQRYVPKIWKSTCCLTMTLVRRTAVPAAVDCMAIS